jgi:hypothetical protein
MLLIGFSFFILIISIPLLEPAFRVMNEFNVENYEIAIKEVEKFQNNVIKFEDANHEYNISSSFTYSGKIMVFVEPDESEQIISFRFSKDNNIDYISIKIDESYKIIIDQAHIAHYFIYRQNNSKFIRFEN